MTEIRDALNKTEVPNKLPNKLPNNSEILVVDLLLKSPNLTVTEIASKIGITDRAVRNIINSLKRQGLLERIGSKKSGYWKVLM